MIQQHGGNIFRYSDILDFSANINPLGMTENIRLAIERSAKDAEKYPDPFCTELREKIALHENTVPERIVCGNGADDLIFRAVHALKPKKALVCQPTFSEYSRALSETDCKITEYPLSESEEFELNQDFIQSLSPDLDMCILCTPNNPTGKLIQPEILSQISERCRENGIILMCDECFMGFVKNSAKYSIVNFMNKNLIVLKAFTKIFAVPGIRLGYAVCGDTETACKLSESGQFWSVSSVAQAVGITALDEKKYLEETAEYTDRERTFLYNEIKNAGLKVFGSSANFLLFKGDENLYDKMLAEKILVRDCRNYSGLYGGFCRIAVRTHSENQKFTNALKRCING